MRRLALLLAVCTTASSLAAAEPVDFDAQVAPLLAAHCLDCHSGGEPKGSLDLSRAATVLKGGDAGPAIVPGSEERSLLWKRIADDEMPPKKPLTAKDKELLRAWLTGGAKWGTDPIDPFRTTTDHRAGRDWWSLQPLRTPALPASASASGATPLDRFVLEQLRTLQLAPSPPADKRTLIRRLTFDLTGLPPTPAEIHSFLNDDSPQAVEKLVDRLLASPAYGERWARHWLDVAHFGESDGFEYDRMRPNAWPYRDWVIQALNDDLPYDELARLQIAGDVFKPADAAALTATGFLVHGAHDGLLPAGDAMRQIMRQDELEDIVGLVGQTFLGLTVNCARCHDHKFDPIATEDYYRLASALAGVRRGDRPLPPKPVPAELSERLAKLRAELQRLDAAVRARLPAPAAGVKPPAALVRWEFDAGYDDESGTLRGRVEGGARLDDGSLVLDGRRAFAASAPLTRDVREKTLEAWVRLQWLRQRGGGVVTLQTLDGGVFDSIVFAERDAGRWMAGSDNFRRTKSFEAPAETVADKDWVQVVITYQADGTIACYRNGEPYGKPYQTSPPITFRTGQAQVVFGVRHTPAGDGKMLDGRIQRAALYDRALAPQEVADSFTAVSNIVTGTQLRALMSDAEKQRRAELTESIRRAEDEAARFTSSSIYTINPQQPGEATHVLLRGNPAQRGAVVAPGGLASLPGTNYDFGLDPQAPEGERRKKLAEWITHPANPLFARTMVNRVWHYHFGRGLIETPNDLGFNGGRPTSAPLLDYLAAEFIRGGYRLKSLHRLIVVSQTYRQSSLPRAECLAIDKDNRFLWRMSPQRLEAEAVRDAVLAVAGQLNSQRGGPSFQDFKPYVNHNTQFYEPLDPVGPEYQRRSIYRMWARGGKSPLLDVLDSPDPSTATPKRGRTTTPLQALSMLNNSFMLRMSDALAARLGKESGPAVEAQIDLAYELVYGRPPRADELRLAEAFVRQHGLAPFCRVLLNTNGFLYVD